MTGNVDRLSSQELRESREAWWSAEFDDLLWTALGRVGGGRVLDVGCGIGTLAERLGPRLSPGSELVGVDVDLSRLGVARLAAAGANASWAAADGLRLPFRDCAFRASVTILTLQHVPEPARMLAEMRRVTAPGGTVAAVEPDNAGQRLYLPEPSDDLDRAVEEYWRRIGERHRPADMSTWPRLPRLFLRAGLSRPSLRGFLLARIEWLEPSAFAEQATERFRRVARKYGVENSSECAALLEAVRERAARSASPFCAISTVPLFLAFARV